MDEQKKYEVIKKLVDENGNKDRATLTLGITKRHVYRLELQPSDEEINLTLKTGLLYFLY